MKNFMIRVSIFNFLWEEYIETVYVPHNVCKC